ncbi:MAG: hypothetical protein Q9169_007635 [Polycauliona sp. 2 TL-2023]
MVSTLSTRNSISKLALVNQTVDSTIKSFAEYIKSLSNTCDVLCADVKEVVKRSETGSPLPLSTDASIWRCLTAQVEEASRTIQEVNLFVKGIKEEKSDYIGQAQCWRILEKTQDQIPKIRTKVSRHEENLNDTLILISTILAFDGPGQVDGGFDEALHKLQGLLGRLQTSSSPGTATVGSNVETTLLQCAHELIVQYTTLHTAGQPEEYLVGDQGTAASNVRVAEWVSTLESIRRDHRLSDSTGTVSKVPLSGFSGGTSVTSGQQSPPEDDIVGTVENESDDDLETDLAKVAMGTGTKAFEAQDWEEADSFLQEALRIL